VIVAIHQPNYLPWLGYFYKIARADVFVFLDDAQYSKNSYTNRVQVSEPGGAKWLTVPVSYNFGDLISDVRPAVPDWPSRHMDTIRNYYRSAPCYRAVWPRIIEFYDGVRDADLASINRFLIERISSELGLDCRFTASSEMPTGELTSDNRLVALVASVDPAGTYLSGKGGVSYQDPDKFEAAGLGFRYTEFQHPRYFQGDETFIEGLSILDAVFHLGWKGAADLIIHGTAA
jgi:hypothetical protein